MGLRINSYKYSYGMLQNLRRWALEIEKNKNQKLMCPDFDGYSILDTRNCGKCIYCLLSNAKDIKEEKAITKFPELISHSDCDGGYAINPSHRNNDLGDLGNLKLELIELNRHTRPTGLEQAFKDLYNDVIEEKEYLKFTQYGLDSFLIVCYNQIIR